MVQTTDVWRRLLDVARRQHNLVTRDQVFEIGGSDSWLRRQVGAAQLVKMGRRVYAVRPALRTREQTVLAACLDLGPDAVLSHGTAAEAWRLLLPGRDIHVTVPFDRSSRGSGSGIVIHRCRRLSPKDRALVGVLPVTTASRTLLDLASSLNPEALARVVEDAICRGLVTPARVAAAIDRCAPRGGPGRRPCAMPYVRGSADARWTAWRKGPSAGPSSGPGFPSRCLSTGC
jgi:hypothetical protein